MKQLFASNFGVGAAPVAKPAAAMPAPPAAKVAEGGSQVPWRMVIFFVIVVCVVGFPVCIFLRAAITGGIERKGDLFMVDLKAMGDFGMDQSRGTSADIPQKFRDLDGQRVMLEGEMWCGYSAAGEVDAFQLCYSVANCCFAGPPQAQHFVQATVPVGHHVRYHRGSVKVVGTLHVGVEQADGRVLSVYRLDVESVDAS
jgi:hypothetical protein